MQKSRAFIGREVWPATLDFELWNENDEDGVDVRRGFIDAELGFAKPDREWVLATRVAKYEWDYTPSGELDQDGMEKMVARMASVASSSPPAGSERFAARRRDRLGLDVHARAR